MKIGILAAGAPPRSLQPRFGDYSTMFEALLAGHGFDWRSYDVPGGDWPQTPEACEAYLVTGSAAGAYDSDPWIGELIGFLRAAKGRARLVGVCFGHQAMAQAFGGKVVKSPKGWGVGLHTYEVSERPAWMGAGAERFSLAASHQDQVVEIGPAAQVLGGSDFCPYGLISYDGADAISCQLHPEFAPEYAAALIEGRRGTRFEAALADQALESLARPNDRGCVAGWIATFLEGG